MIDSGPLRKILELERQRGFADTSVFGGLDKFIVNWSGQALSAAKNPELLKKFRHFFNVSYAAMESKKRRQWTSDVLELLDELEGITSVKIAPDIVVGRPAAPVKPRKKIKKTPAPALPHSLNSPVTAVKGISTTLAAKFGKLGVRTVRDLLYFFPRRHIDYSRLKSISELEEGIEQTIIVNVWQAQETKLGGRRSTEAIVGDETGNIRVVWFNQPYLARKLTTNSRVILSGRVSLFKGRLVFQSPEWELVEGQDFTHTGRLVPVYPLTQGMRARQVRKIMKDFVDIWAAQVTDFLPSDLRERLELLELPEAISQAHYPDDEITNDKARVRLAFDELFLLQLGVMDRKREWQQSRPGTPLDTELPVVADFIESLPFTLTGAQQRVLAEVMNDLSQTQPMCRLLQGEVGSGKTVVATAALLAAVASGFQVAFMAPTEILAEQHFATVCGLLARMGAEHDEDYVKSYDGITDSPLKVALLIGDINQAGKKVIGRQIQRGETDIIIGTHALVQKGVDYHKLGLAVVDEQHRFGVEQRSALREKGFSPHMLVMTATPIPRTLALTLYGDLDLSVINELPPGRPVVKTKWLKPEQRASAYAFVRKQVGEGRQAFVICPLIEESDSITAQAAVVEYERLSDQVFPDLRLGLLHGRLSSADKDAVMESFRAGELDILVSTTVIEVGIDVPNATVMMVESAERFGLSQLHQLRGRVGRGTAQSYCMLLAGNPTDVGRQRLDIIEKTQDGFELAEADLKMRGPGEFFGTRQSGMPDLRMARISDIALLELARNEAVRLFEIDPGLARQEHRLLAAEVARVWTIDGELS